LNAFEGAGTVVDALNQRLFVAGGTFAENAFVHNGVFHGSVVAVFALVRHIRLGGDTFDDAFAWNAVDYVACNETGHKEQQAYGQVNQETLAATNLVVAAFNRFECLSGMEPDVIKIVVRHLVSLL
jgi:hypothetical protein